MMNYYYLLIMLNLIFYLPAHSIADEFLEYYLIRYYDHLDTIQENQTIFLNNDNITRANQDFISVSLGYNCEPAIYTKKFNIRTFAFPFDWCLTPYQALYNFIYSDFKDFFKLEHLIPSSKIQLPDHMAKLLTKTKEIGNSECNLWVLDKQSGMIFNHDFTNNHPKMIQACYDEPNNKYQRRISRLLNQVNSDKHIYFIRYRDISKNKAIKLVQLIESKFTKGNFTLIVVSGKPEFGENWNVPRLKSYCLASISDWEKICSDIRSGKLKNTKS